MTLVFQAKLSSFEGMTWSEVAAIVSGSLSLVVLLASALARETSGELKRRLDVAESKLEAQTQKVARLEERTTGTTETLKRIEETMVPRKEWESRHAQTDEMLARILRRLDDDHGRDRLASSPGPKR